MTDAESMADLLRDAANAFFADKAGGARLRGWVGRPRPVDRALWAEMAALGWTGLLLPEALGGSGLSLAEAGVLTEAAGQHLLAEPLIASAVMPALLLASADADSDLAMTLADLLLSGQRLLTVAWQEAAGQLELAQPNCTVTDGYLSGTKLFVLSCESDAVLLVWAQQDGEPVWVAVNTHTAGVQRDVEAAGLASQASVRFDCVPVLGKRPLLRGVAAQQALAAMLAGGRLTLAAELTGLAAACLAETLAHLRTRQQFDRSLGSFQSVQHRCVDLHLEIELASAAWQQADGVAVLLAKARASDAAVRVGREAVQLHGAMGFCDEVDIGLRLRAALYGSAWLGSPVALRRRFAATPMAEAA